MEESQFDKLSHQANEHLWPHYTMRDAFPAMAGSGIVVEARGSYYIDSKGKRYLDVTGGFHCCLVGHGRQEVTDAVYQQMNGVEFVGEFVGFTTIPTAGLASRLAQMTPGDLSKVYFSLSATEAIEDALKMVIQYQAQSGYPRKYKVLFRDGSHYGYTFGAMGRKMTRFMLDNGLYFYTHGSRFEIHPCLTIIEDEIDEMVSILDRTVGYAEKELGIA